LPAGQHRGRGRFHRNELGVRLAFFNHLGHTGNGATGADAGHEDVHLAVGVAPDLFGGGFAVDRRVGRVLELLWHEIPLVGLGKFLSLGDGPRHALSTRGQDEFGAVGQQQLPPFDTHGFGHGQDETVAARRGYLGERDAGVTAGRLKDDGFRCDEAGCLGGVDQRHPKTVLHAGRRVERFQLRDHVRVYAVGDPIQPDQGSVSN
jgi:hypothetical protein